MSTVAGRCLLLVIVFLVRGLYDRLICSMGEENASDGIEFRTRNYSQFFLDGLQRIGLMERERSSKRWQNSSRCAMISGAVAVCLE